MASSWLRSSRPMKLFQPRRRLMRATPGPTNIIMSHPLAPASFQCSTLNKASFYSTFSQTNDKKQKMLTSLDRFIDQLHTKVTPLGCMSSYKWDKSLVALRQLLNENNADQSNQNKSDDYDDDHDDDKGIRHHSIPLTGWAVASADRIWQRLVCELAATRPTKATARQTSFGNRSSGICLDDLASWNVNILQAWLKLTQRVPSSQLAIDRAERSWQRVMEWKRREWWIPNNDQDHHGMVATSPAIAILRAWLALQSPECASRAAELLLSDVWRQEVMENDSVGPDMEESRSTIIGLYNEALRQCIQFASHLENGTSLASALLEQMKHLVSSMPNWEALKPDEELVKALITGTLDKGEPQESGQVKKGGVLEDTRKKKGLLSSFETTELQKQMIQTIQGAASDADRSQVEQVISQLQKSSLALDLALLLAQAAFEYYIRIQDAKLATKWLSQLENKQKQLGQGDRIQATLKDHYLVLIGLWECSGHAEAPWRADEILQRLERLGPVDASLYQRVASLWTKSNDPQRRRKVMDLSTRARSFDVTLSIDLLSEDSSSLGEATIASAIEHVKHDWSNIVDREQVVTEIAKTIEKSKQSSMSFELVQLLAENHETPSVRICEHLLGAFDLDSPPERIIDLLNLLKASGARLNFRVFHAAIQSLLGASKLQNGKHIEHLLKLALAEAQLDSTVTVREVHDLLVQTMTEFTKMGHTDDSIKLLKMAEDELIRPEARKFDVFPIPMDCYVHLGKLHLSNREFDDVKMIFEKVQNYYEAGHIDMAPTNTMFDAYISSLSHSLTVKASELEQLLDQLVQVYERTGDERFKPLSSTIFEVLRTLSREDTTLVNAHRGQQLLERMLALGVHFRTAAAFNLLMELYLQSDCPDPYQTIKSIEKRLGDSGVMPDLDTLHSILTSCERACAADKEEALETVHECLGKIRELGKVNKVTYLQVFRAVKSLLSPERSSKNNALLLSLVEKCRQDKCLTGEIVELLRDILTKKD